MNIRKIATGTLAGALGSLLLAASAFAATDVTISGNGNNSHNGVVVGNSSECNIVQGNFSVIGTHASSKAKTGKNKANNNTGNGTKTVSSGRANSTTTVNTATGGNTITSQPCCECQESETTVEIKNNGNGSHNRVVVGNHNSKNVIQFNKSFVWTSASSVASTGGNEANANTGAGDVSVTSGNATSSTSVTTTTGSNSM